MERRQVQLIVLLGLFGILLLVNGAASYPAESSSTKPSESTTTGKPAARHPNYVRLLNRKSNQNESVLVDNRSGKSGAELLATLPNNRNLTADEIKSIIPYLEFSTERSSLFSSSFGSSFGSSSSSSSSSDRPRGISGLLNLLMGPINALRNFGNRGRSSNSFDNNASGSGFKLNVANFSNDGNKTANASSSGSTSRSSSSASSTTKSSSTSSPANNLLAGPGRFLAGMMKTVQNMTVTFQDMIMSFLRLFNFNRNNTSNKSN